MSQVLLAGIDVSEWQGVVDWQNVKQAGTAFAFARATYGATLVDPQFSANWQGMRAAGIVRGTYHFFVTADDPTQQADLFIKTVGSLDGSDLPPVLDVESESGTGSNLISGVQTWLGLVEQGLRRQPMIYTGPSFWNEYMTGGFGSYPLWVSEYEVSAPKQVNGWNTWAFWQYSSTGTVSGITGSVDLDYFNGSLNDLEAFINSPVGATATSPPPNNPSEPSHTQTYTVQSGDTLDTIANRYGTTINAICQTNGITDPNMIRVGQVLTIP
jgi:lysozyme